MYMRECFSHNIRDESEGVAMEDFVHLNGKELPDTETAFTDQQLNNLIQSLCISKADEFAVLGYSGVTGNDVWECLHCRYVKLGLPSLHFLVEDIISLRANDYMTWRTLSIYK